MINKDPKNIKAIFITHEHSDHIKGADVLAASKYSTLCNKRNNKNGFLCSDESLINEIKNNVTTSLFGMEVEAFSKSHAAADPVSYTIANKKRVSVITDAGHICHNIRRHVAEADFIFLESNHDVNMLETGPYPYPLKKWIKGDTEHLSNKQAALCSLEHANQKLSNIVLSHLSETNNTPQIAMKTFKSLLKERLDLKTKIMVSQKHSPTQLFKLN